MSALTKLYKKYHITRFFVVWFSLFFAGMAFSVDDNIHIEERAKALIASGKFKQAKRDFQYLVRENPSNASYQYQLASVLYHLGELDEAYSFNEAALQIDSEFIPALLLKANKLFIQNDEVGAIAIYESILAIDNLQPDALQWLSNIWESLGDQEAADHYYQQYKALDIN